MACLPNVCRQMHLYSRIQTHLSDRGRKKEASTCGSGTLSIEEEVLPYWPLLASRKVQTILFLLNHDQAKRHFQFL